MEIYSVLPQRVRPAEPSLLDSAVVDCAAYVDGVRMPTDDGDRIGHRAALDVVAARRSVGQDAFVWIGLHEPDAHQIEVAAEVFELHPLVARRLGRLHRRPSAHWFDDVLVLTLKTLDYREHDTLAGARSVVAFGELVVAIGQHVVVAVRHGEHDALTDVRREVDESAVAQRLGRFGIAHAIADHVVTAYVGVADRLQSDVDELEGNVFSTAVAVDLEHAYLLKREITEMRRAVVPLVDDLARVLTDAGGPIPVEVRRRLRDVLDRAQQIAGRIEDYDEVLTSLWVAALGRAAGQQNADMRKISAWVALASVPTMLAAIYGMNFENMPELRWEWGYPAVLSVMVAACAVLAWRFRRARWL